MQEPIITDEAKRILDEARRRNILLRLLGGVAVRYHCPSASHRALQRSYPDLDFIGLGKQGREVKQVFLDLGYQPNQRFNALHGRTRLMFEDLANNRLVDIFLDIFKMCHALQLGERLALDEYTIPISDLLLTKLQVVEMNEKDVRDIIAILQDHDVATSQTHEDRESLDGNYIARLTAEDWPLWRTITLSLEKIRGLISKYELGADQNSVIEERINRLRQTIEEAPKSLKWKIRSSVGEKKRWYDLPEIPIRT